MALADNLIGYYRFDDTGTTLIDSSSGNNGVIVGSPTSSSGIINNSLLFSSESTRVGDFNTQIVPTSNWTVSVWVYLSDASGNNQILTNRNDGLVVDYLLSVNANNAYVESGYSSGHSHYHSVAGNGTPIANNNWTHITYIYRDATETMQLYVNGVEQAITYGSSGHMKMTNVSTHTAFAVQYISGTWFFDPAGQTRKIDECGIWSRALSATEVTELYNNGNGLSYPFTLYNSPFPAFRKV